MSNKSARHNKKLLKAQKNLRRAYFGLICGAIATIIAWVLLTINIYNHNPIAPSAVFAGVMTLIFILNIVALDSNKKKVEKFPAAQRTKDGIKIIPPTKKELQQQELAKQKKKGKNY
ncbi:MAG: hypothetical protein MJ146_03800 [Clostridia bacterium]|nr:hypothetical protein [Clostridia bacterium]